MKRLLLFGAVCAALALSACAGQGGLSIGGSGSAVGDVVTFTDTDLDNAEAQAVAAHDDVATPCYPALKVWVDSVPGGKGSITVSGLASGFEASRVAVNGVQGGIPKAVVIACGPLYMETHGQFLKLLGGGGLLGKVIP